MLERRALRYLRRDLLRERLRKAEQLLLLLREHLGVVQPQAPLSGRQLHGRNDGNVGHAPVLDSDIWQSRCWATQIVDRDEEPAPLSAIGHALFFRGSLYSA